ncbi:galactoside O-acetyltransferase [Enterovibrio norvegicus FF-33]|uniref:methyltransferase domain-containing protein n=1 Tax=Enterovibrio norvegicus TaxID=188144 RepID=UPI0002E2CAFC|nr:methyltransferase domain-containing protein [Enterovibrio norvegicus]OEE68105.1 galactoside O-acetyltransferase [Enterovibrio norvegicus FF-33]
MATERLYFSSDSQLNIESNAEDLDNIERHESRYQFAAKQLTCDSLVLDCACGSGYGSDILKAYCKNIIGVDIDPDAIRFAENKYKADNLKFVCGDIRELAPSLEPVDTVVCLETLEHVEDPRILLDGFMKVLKPDGQLVISTPVRETSRENPLNSYHVLEFTNDDLKRILSNYFHEVEIRIQDQDRFIRIDENIHWGFALAICKYPKNMTIGFIDTVIKDREPKEMEGKKNKSIVSDVASIAGSAIFKPNISHGCYDIADGVEIRENVVIENHNGGKFKIGKNSVLGYGCWVNATGNILIGDNTLIGANTIITSSSHHIKENTPIANQGMSLAQVTVGSNVWIGSNVSILKGVTIGDNSVIGANCVIKADVASDTILKSSDAIVEERKKTNKVAFYLLPFKMRESALTFECIYDRYKKLAESFRHQDWDVVFISTNELAQKISKDGWSTISPSTYNVDYDNATWFQRWKRILNSESDELHEQFLSNMLSDQLPEIVFCWNFDGLLKQQCYTNKISIYFNELGISRTPNPTIYYSDPDGVNNKSAFLDFWSEFGDFKLSEHEKTISRLTLAKVRSNYPQPRHQRREYIFDSLDIPESCRIVLVVLQVEDDSNIVAGSKYETMKEFVNDCLTYGDENTWFVIKKHPGQPDCELDTYERAIVADNEISTEELIAISNDVFTINSSLGFEACLAGKKVYTFGKSPYTEDRIIVDATKSKTNSIFQDSPEADIEDDLLLKFVYLTYHQYFLSERKFFDAETHLRRHKLKKLTSDESKAYFFDHGSYFKERELDVNRFQNKVLQDSILGYENWIQSLKETESSVHEVSSWAQSLDKQLAHANQEIDRLSFENDELKLEYEQALRIQHLFDRYPLRILAKIVDKIRK